MSALRIIMVVFGTLTAMSSYVSFRNRHNAKFGRKLQVVIHVFAIAGFVLAAMMFVVAVFAQPAD